MRNSHLFERRRHEIRISRLAILCGFLILSGRAIRGQVASAQKDLDALVAGCASGAFDSYPALKANCPTQKGPSPTIITQPLAYTPQQLAEMNKYAQQDAAALQQYLQKPVTPLVLPSTGDTSSFLPNTKLKSDSSEYQPMPIYSLNGNSSAVLAGIAEAESYRRRSTLFVSLDSSLKLAQAQRELAKVKAELAAHIAWGKFLEQQRATQEAGSRELAEAMAAGAPIVKDGLTLDEAKNLQRRLNLDPHQKHIFPNMLTIAFDSNGQMHFDVVGLPIDEFRYTLVGDLITPHEQEIIRAKSWEGFESAPNEVGDFSQNEATATTPAPPSGVTFDNSKTIDLSPQDLTPVDGTEKKLTSAPPRTQQPDATASLATEPNLYSTMDWLNTSSANADQNQLVQIGAASYVTSIYSPLLATGPGEGRIVLMTTASVFSSRVDRVEASFNIRDIDASTVALRKSPHGNFHIFTARTKDGALKIHDRTHDRNVSSIAFEIAPEYGPRFAKAFKRAVILAAREQASSPSLP
jgi:hypothetical protein